MSSDYIDICYDLMKPYTYMLYLTYLLPCELESHTSRGDYNCTKKICWLCFPVEFFFPLCNLRSIVKERIFSRNLTKTRCILIQHFQQHYPLFNLKINCKKKEKKNRWKEGKFIVHVYTNEGLISLVISCFFVPRNWGAPAFLLKTLKWGNGLKRPAIRLGGSPFRQSLIFWWEKWVSGRGCCCWAASASTTT